MITIVSRVAFIEDFQLLTVSKLELPFLVQQLEDYNCLLLSGISVVSSLH